MTHHLFRNINIIGLGLIGGSLAKACKKHQIGEHISGFDIDKFQTDFALKHNVIDSISDLQELTDDDLIIIGAPLFAYKTIFERIAPIAKNATIIDIGSLKEFALPLSKEVLKEKSVNFIACHPIAGSDKSGVQNSDDNLFFDKKVIITPNQNTDKNKLQTIELFWREIGAKPELMDANEHDKIFALVSHLPQFLSFIAYENFQNGDDEILNKHFRLQNSNPKIWQEIFGLNRANIEHYLGLFVKNIDEVVDNLSNKKSENKSSSDNYDLIIRRLFLVSCFLNLPDIKSFQKHSGTGFKDFTAILEHDKILKNNPILENHKDSIITFLKHIKSRISHYEFS